MEPNCPHNEAWELVAGPRDAATNWKNEDAGKKHLHDISWFSDANSRLQMVRGFELICGTITRFGRRATEGFIPWVQTDFCLKLSHNKIRRVWMYLQFISSFTGEQRGSWFWREVFVEFHSQGVKWFQSGQKVGPNTDPKSFWRPGTETQTIPTFKEV